MMRKVFITKLFLLQLAVLGPLLCFRPGSAQDTDNDSVYIAVAVKVVPPVQLRRSDKEEFVPLKRDDRIFPGDRIVCAEGGYASLIFTDSAVEIKLFPNTELILQGKRSEDTILKRLFLPVGRLWTKVKRGDVEVITPSSVASVKGTEWWTLVEPSNFTKIVVIEGDVEVLHRPTSRKETVTAGFTAVANPGGMMDVSPTDKFDAPQEPPESDGSSLEIEFEDESGEKKTLRIEFEE